MVSIKLSQNKEWVGANINHGMTMSLTTSRTAKTLVYRDTIHLDLSYVEINL